MKKIIILSLIVCIIFLIFNNNVDKFFNTNETKVTNNIIESTEINQHLTETSELNSNVKIEYISKGMNIDKFKEILTKKENYVNKGTTYQHINYQFEKHLHYEELEDIYNRLNNSTIVKLEIIGKSFDKKNIYSIEIGNGNDQIMFEGNIHAVEIAPALFLTKYAVDIVNEYENNNKDIMNLLNNHKIVIVPTANPDGYEYTLFGRKTINNKDSFVYINDSDIQKDYYKANINGVDLNRNFPSQTGGLYFTDNKPSYTLVTEKSTQRMEYFPGYSLASEPETQALIYWMYKHYKNSHAYISVHSAGQIIYNGKPSLSDEFNKLSSECASIVNKYTNYEILGKEFEDEGYGNDGTSTDMISEIIHGYKMSHITGRLSTTQYNPTSNALKNRMCILTIETLERYTQDLKIIKTEYNNKELNSVFTELTQFKA